MPDYVADTQRCFLERGFAYVSHFGVEFARAFLQRMERFNSAQIAEQRGVHEKLNSGGSQLFLPRRAAAARASAGAAAGAAGAVGQQWLTSGLDAEWEQLCKQVALYVGAIQPEHEHKYHVQDTKVSAARGGETHGQSALRLLSLCCACCSCTCAVAVHASRQRRAGRVSYPRQRVRSVFFFRLPQ